MSPTVVIADDQELVRSGRMVLEARGVEVLGEAPDGRRALELVSAMLPDVVLMDIRMPSFATRPRQRRDGARHSIRPRLKAVTLGVSPTHADRRLAPQPRPITIGQVGPRRGLL